MSRRVLVAAVVLFLVAGSASTLYTQHQSCLRTNGTRSGLESGYRAAASRAARRALIDTGAARNIDLQAAASAMATAGLEHQLACSRLFPPTR